ncbi:MAG: hypothetical protein H0W84_10695 [Bacteroidetes bacterium]|nr:hypothetical protein [Bacteroidota bacterium]
MEKLSGKKISFVTLVVLLSFFGFSFQKEQIFRWDRLEFEKTGCLNKCKSFKINIDRKGNAVYEGMSNTSMLGRYSRRLNCKENKNLWKLIYSARPEAMKEEYDYGAEDTQQKFLRCYFGTKVKDIRFGNDVPEVLKKIDVFIEKIIDNKGWVVGEHL